MRQGYSFHVEGPSGSFDIDVQLTESEIRRASMRLNGLLAADRIMDWHVTEYPEKGLRAFIYALEANVE